MDEGGWDRASSSKSPSFTFSRTRSRKPSREIWRMVSSWPWTGEKGQGWEVRVGWICRQPQGVQDDQCVQSTRMGWDEESANLGGGWEVRADSQRVEGLTPVLPNESFI